MCATLRPPQRTLSAAPPFGDEDLRVFGLFDRKIVINITPYLDKRSVRCYYILRIRCFEGTVVRKKHIETLNRLRPRIKGALRAAAFYTVFSLRSPSKRQNEAYQSNLRSSSVSPVKLTLRVGSFLSGKLFPLRFFIAIVCAACPFLFEKLHRAVTRSARKEPIWIYSPLLTR